LITGMLPIGSTTIAVAAVGLSPVLARLTRPGVALGEGLRLLQHRLAGERRLAVDLDAAGAADRGPARTANRQRAILSVLRLQQPVEDRECGIQLDVELLPVRPVARLGLEAPHLQGELSHSSSPYP